MQYHEVEVFIIFMSTKISTLLMLIHVSFICRKTCSASPKRAYKSTCNHEYSNEHLYAGLNDNTVSIATQQHNHQNENYINLDLRSLSSSPKTHTRHWRQSYLDRNRWFPIQRNNETERANQNVDLTFDLWLDNNKAML